MEREAQRSKVMEVRIAQNLLAIRDSTLSDLRGKFVHDEECQLYAVEQPVGQGQRSRPVVRPEGDHQFILAQQPGVEPGVSSEVHLYDSNRRLDPR